jgi:ReqiPepy6 Gp37-like protein
MTNYSVRMWSPTGESIGPLRWKSFDCTLAERMIGVLTIQLFPEYRDDLFQRDCRIALLRAPEGVFIESGKLVGDTMWLLTKRARTLDQNGQHTITLTCQHPNVLMNRRVVAYDEDSAESRKSDLASDVLYDYINENFVAATVAARNISTSHFVLDPRPSPAFGPTLEMEGSYRSVMSILQDAAQSAAAQSSYIGYEVYVQTAPGPFRVRLYNRVRSTDRGATSGQPLIIGPYTAKMIRVDVSEDWSTSVSVAYAGGSGNLDERIVSSQEDTTLSGQSPIGRFEHFESFNADDATLLSTSAYKMLRDYRPHRNFGATIVPYAEQYAGAVYDVNYTWGDIVSAQFNAPIIRGNQLQSWITYQFDCRVNPVHLRATRTFDDLGNPQRTDENVEITLQSVASAT